MKIRNLSLLIGLLVFTLIGAPLVASITGLPVMLIAGGILLSAVMPKGERFALFAEAPDISALATEFVTFGGEIIKKAVNKLSIRTDPFYGFYPNLTKPLALPKLSAAGNPRPYRSNDDTSGNDMDFTDRVLTTELGKWDFDFDFTKFHNTYLASDNEQPYREFMLSHLNDEFMAQINNNVVFLGDRDDAGTDAADIATGWGTHILDDIAGDAEITVVATGTVDGSNSVTKLEQMKSALPAWARESGDVECRLSYTQFDYYMTNYRATFGYNFNPRQNGFYYLDGTNIRIKPESYIGSSNRIIFSVAKNLSWGLDKNNMSVYATARRNIIEVRPIIGIGFQIADTARIWVNDQA